MNQSKSFNIIFAKGKNNIIDCFRLLLISTSIKMPCPNIWSSVDMLTTILFWNDFKHDAERKQGWCLQTLTMIAGNCLPSCVVNVQQYCELMKTFNDEGRNICSLNIFRMEEDMDQGGKQRRSQNECHENLQTNEVTFGKRGNWTMTGKISSNFSYTCSQPVKTTVKPHLSPPYLDCMVDYLTVDCMCRRKAQSNSQENWKQWLSFGSLRAQRVRN